MHTVVASLSGAAILAWRSTGGDAASCRNSSTIPALCSLILTSRSGDGLAANLIASLSPFRPNVTPDASASLRMAEALMTRLSRHVAFQSTSYRDVRRETRRVLIRPFQVKRG